MRIIVDLNQDVSAAMADYCVENHTNPQEVVSDLLTALLCHPSDLVVEDTTVTVAEIAYVFCKLIDASNSIEFADADLAERAVMLRANLHEFYLNLLDS